MGKAGQALRLVLDKYGITQNQLAVEMGIRRSNVSRWVSEVRDPTAETLLEIRDGLQKIDPIAADEFIRLYISQASVSENQF